MTATIDPTFELIRNVICKVTKLPPEAVLLENPVTGLQNVDSIVLLEIVARVEVSLDVSIDEQVLFEIQTVGDFVKVCQELVAAKGADKGASGGAVADGAR
ncbi:MAG TPA: acyl carrier protein [Kofleriaceae bacterium]|nr:acyl carrier protein [Kofleriaceae bacterium]